MKQESSLPKLNEFIRSHDEEWEYWIPEDPEKRERQCLIVNTRTALDWLIHNLVQLADGNSVEFSEICDFILDYLRLLEKYHLFHVKTMPNGTIRIYNKIHCRRGPDIWRKCPEYICPGLSCDESWECPHPTLKITWGK